MKVYVINLERSEVRRKNIQRQLNKAKLDHTIVSAVDERTLGDIQKISAYNSYKRKLFYGKDLTRGEIACALSHLKCYKLFLKSNKTRAMIIEDDVILNNGLPAALAVLEQSRDLWDIIRFLSREKHLARSRPVFRLNEVFSLRRNYGTPGGAYAYVINRKAAKYLIDKNKKVWQPIDALQNQVWSYGLRIFSIVPCFVSHDWSLDSTIGNERFGKKKNTNFTYAAARFFFKLYESIAKKILYYATAPIDRFRYKNPK